jgi:hypothetical protein
MTEKSSKLSSVKGTQNKLRKRLLADVAKTRKLAKQGKVKRGCAKELMKAIRGEVSSLSQGAKRRAHASTRKISSGG